MSEKIIIESTRNKPIILQIRKIWEYRALIKVFIIRDIKVHYTQTKLGIFWSLIQALTATVIVNFFFGNLMNIDTGDVPYIIFAFPGMIAWYYFSQIIGFAGTSILQSQHIIKKIYFPKLILPIYKTLVGLFEFLVWFIVFMGICIYYHYPLSIHILFLPVSIILNMITGLSIAIWLAAITVRYRDALLIIPFLIGFGIFVTPVFFAKAMIPENYQILIYLNPMAGVIAFYRWCLLGSGFSGNYLFGFIPVIALFVSGLFYFRRVESIMADLI